MSTQGLLTPQEVESTNDATSSSGSAISIRSGAVRRGKHLVWSQANFDVPYGSITAIVGTNGTGKTTLLEVELGLLSLSEGTVRILGKPAGESNHQIGYVPQHVSDPMDGNLTALQSVLLGITGNRFGFHINGHKEQLAALEALRQAGVEECAKKRLSELSGGQRQRVSIAQAIVSQPSLLILDEPLANLDLPSQRSIVEVLSNLNNAYGTTIQIVTHDMNMLLPILTGAIYLLDGHPHYAAMHEVLDADLLTHLYGTTVEVMKTVQGDMFVTAKHDHHDFCDMHRPEELVHIHEHHQQTSVSPSVQGA